MQIFNIELEELTDSIVSIIYEDQATGLPIDLTGFSAIMELRYNFGDGNVILTLTDTNQGIELGGVTGNIDMIFSRGQTDQRSAQMAWSRAAYDLILIDPQGNRKKIIKGFVTVARSATLD